MIAAMITSSREPTDELPGDEFPIGPFRTRWKLACLPLLLVMIALRFAGSAFRPESASPFGGQARLMIVLLGLLTATLISITGWTGRADREGFTVEGLVRKRRIPWSTVRGMTTMGNLRPWLPRWFWWSRGLRIEYVDPAGKLASIDLAPGSNSERFRLLVARKIGVSSPAPIPEPGGRG